MITSTNKVSFYTYTEAMFFTCIEYCFLVVHSLLLLCGAVSSVVERLPYKQVVTGSNPVPPNVSKKTTYQNYHMVNRAHRLRD